MKRREMLQGALAIVVLPLHAAATPATVAAAMRDVTGGAPVKPGKIKLELPPIAENGNAVPVTMRVDSPMTEADHVKSLHLFAEGNPLPNVVHVQLGPRAGRAYFATRMRLATSQKVIALAQLSDGSFWSDSGEIVVTLAACVEE